MYVCVCGCDFIRDTRNFYFTLFHFFAVFYFIFAPVKIYHFYPREISTGGITPLYFIVPLYTHTFYSRKTDFQSTVLQDYCADGGYGAL